MVILFLKAMLTKREVLVVMTCDISVMQFSSIVTQFYCCKLHNRNLGCSGRRWHALYYAFASCSLQEHKHQVFLPLSTTKFCGVQCLPREFTLKLENGDILNSMSFIDHHEHRAPRAPVAKIKSIYVSPLSISLSYPVSKTWYNLRPHRKNKPQYKTSVTLLDFIKEFLS